MPRPLSPAGLSRRRVLALAGWSTCSAAAWGQSNLVTGDGRPVEVIEVPFVTTPPAVVEAMLDLAQVGANDMVYDLGCGDGRIVIEAARRGARGVGVDIDRDLIEQARTSAQQAGVHARVRFEQGDLFAMDFRDASVVMLYLSDALNLRLWPRLKAQLKPGSRIVSHRFGIAGLTPQRTIALGDRNLYLWRS